MEDFRDETISRECILFYFFAKNVLCHLLTPTLCSIKLGLAAGSARVSPMSGKSESHAFESGRFVVEPGKKLDLSKYDPGDKGGLKNKKALGDDELALADAQELLWANGSRSVLIIFEALDAAGKDGSIKHYF